MYAEYLKVVFVSRTTILESLLASLLVQKLAVGLKVMHSIGMIESC